MQSVVTRALNVKGTYIYSHSEFGEAIEFIRDTSPIFPRLFPARFPLTKPPECSGNLRSTRKDISNVWLNFNWSRGGVRSPA